MQTALKTMILIFTFYKIKDNGFEIEKEYLQSFLIEHKIWKDFDFWKSAIYNSIINELKLQRAYHIDEKESSIEITNREKNIIFGQLAAFGQNMMMFGIEKKDIFQLMNRYFEYFELEETQLENLKVNFKKN